MTAGAHSSQPSRRSALAPSDSWRLWLPGSSVTGSVPVATCAFTLIGVFLPSGPAAGLGGSRDQALRLQGVIELAGQRILCGRRVDTARRGDLVRDVNGHDLVEGCLGPYAGVLELLQDVCVERIVGEQLRIAVEAGDRRRDTAHGGADQLVLRVPQARRGLEGQRLV